MDTGSALDPTASAHSGSPSRKWLTQQKHKSHSWLIRKLVTSGGRQGLGQVARPPLCLGLAVALPYLGFLQDSSSPGHPACLTRRAGAAFTVVILAQHKLRVYIGVPVRWQGLSLLCVLLSVDGGHWLTFLVPCSWSALRHPPLLSLQVSCPYVGCGESFADHSTVHAQVSLVAGSNQMAQSSNPSSGCLSVPSTALGLSGSVYKMGMNTHSKEAGAVRVRAPNACTWLTSGSLRHSWWRASRF